MIKKFLIILFVLVGYSTFVVNGQTVNADIELSDGQTLVETTEGYHILLGTSGIVQISVEDEFISKLNSIELTIKYKNSEIEKKTLDAKIVDGKLSISLVDLSEHIKAIGVYKYICLFNYVLESGETRYYTLELPSIFVWEPPIASLEKTKYELIDGDVVSISLDTIGGNNEGWLFKWGLSWTSDAEDEYIAYNKSDELITDEKVVEVINYAPDNKTEWGRFSINYEIDVYPAPQIILPTATVNQACFSKQSLPLEVKVKGGIPNGWEYKWTLDGKTIGRDASLTVAPENYSDSKLEYNYVVEVINKCNGEVRYLESREYNVVVWPEANAQMKEQYPTNMIVGDAVIMSIVAKGGDPDKWDYSWSENEREISKSATYELVARRDESVSSNNSVDYIYNIKAKNTPDNCDESYIYEYNHKIKVWDKPEIESKSEHEQYCCGGDEFTLFVEPKGGQSDGWSYRWISEGIEVGNDKVLKITPKNTTREKQECKYSVEVVNKCDGTSRFSEIYDFTIIVWPDAIIGIDQELDAYYEDEVIMTVSAEGGNDNGWSFEWDSSETTDTKSYIVQNDYNKDSKYTDHKVRIINTYKEKGDLYDKEFVIRVNEWSRGKLNGILSDSLDIYAGNNLELKADVKGGYEEGWDFTWNIDGTDLNENTQSITHQFINNSNQVKTLKCYVDAINRIGDVTGSSHSKYVTLRVWPKIETPNEFNESITQIREGNTLNLSIEPAVGGYSYYSYSSNWYYEWAINGSIKAIGTSMSYNLNQINFDFIGKGKDTKTITCAVKMENKGPNGKLWYSKTIEEDITVYRRPEMPSRLVQKGNGTSKTMILEMPSVISDSEIEMYDYKFVFGYTDRYGKDYKSEPVNKRYYVFDSNVYDNSDNKFWVISQWKYDDGATVTSGKRFINGYDISFDGSDYTNSSRGPNSVEGVENDELLVFDGRKIKMSSAEQTMINVNIYTTNGTLVRAYDSCVQSEELIDFEGLSKGVYFVEIYVEGEKYINKILL